MKRIAVIGAGGYVGARFIEKAVLRQDPSLVPIVRSSRSQGRLARYGVRTVSGDANKTESLVPQLQGCDMAVNLTMGENTRMVENVQAIHKACRIAGVPLLVHMSSAEVFGRAEVPGLQDDSTPAARHWMEYGRTKAAAEAWLRTQFDGPVKVVILRPGLIWGPGSGWLVGPAQSLVDGTAYLFNEGRGICNLIHVDNLIHHIEQLARADHVESAIFNVSDIETHTWLDYYTAIAGEIGVDPSTIKLLPESAYRETVVEKIGGLAQLAPARAIKSRMTAQTKVRIKQRLADRLHPPIRVAEPVEPAPAITKPQWWLHGTVQKLPSRAFGQQFPDTQLQPFSELMSAAGKWLRYAGFQAQDAEWS
jgi:nucleoside-diphosphate-sugar epimerase